MRLVVLAVALLGCAPSMDLDAPSPMDVHENDVPAPDVPAGCCPISTGAMASCECGFLVGGSRAAGCPGPVCDFYASRMIVDSNGCPRWVDDDPCRLCMSDAGPSCDSGPR